MDVLLTIGEFSKMTYLSVKALRHYHDVGLLEPMLVDPATGYRRYGASQVGTAQAIRRFRDLDMPIDEVRARPAGARSRRTQPVAPRSSRAHAGAARADPGGGGVTAAAPDRQRAGKPQHRQPQHRHPTHSRDPSR